MNSPLEYVLLNSHKPAMITFMEAHPECLSEAVKLAIGNKDKLAWRSAWMLSDYLEKNDRRIKPYLKKIIKAVEGKPDGQQRELLKLIQLMKLDDEGEGMVYDLCTGLWKEIRKSPSVRINALKCLLDILKRHPELKEEIQFLCGSEYLEALSAGAKRSVQRMLNEALTKA